MKSLDPQFKIKALRGLSKKQLTPKVSLPVMPNEDVNAQLKRKVDPDYLPKRKRDLTSRLFKS